MQSLKGNVMEGLPDSLEGSEAFIFPNGTEMLQRAECSCSADGRQGRHGAAYPELHPVLGSTPTPHNANVYVLCRESEEASVP